MKKLFAAIVVVSLSIAAVTIRAEPSPQQRYGTKRFSIWSPMTEAEWTRRMLAHRYRTHPWQFYRDMWASQWMDGKGYWLRATPRFPLHPTTAPAGSIGDFGPQ